MEGQMAFHVDWWLALRTHRYATWSDAGKTV
jgi:hypothetical protein